MKRSDLKPWYAEGLSFECLPDCAACCTTHGSYAYVYLETGEAEALAEFLEMDLEVFKKQYTTLDDNHPILRMDEPDCPFLDRGRCSVYAARPGQCRTFPFWAEHLRSPKAWKGLREFCPGIDSGPNHALLTIENHLRDRKDD